jgi:hypothetical protein
MNRSIVALHVPRRIGAVITFAKSVAAAMTDNPALPSPTFPIATLQTDLLALDAAEALVLTRAKGTAESRDDKLAAVRADLDSLRAYVQQVANANPAEAEAIIERAGMSVQKPSVHTKGELVAKQGSVSGSVRLVAKSAGDRASYDWQYGTDAKNWTAALPTLQAKTDIEGLVPATLYYFRVRPLTKAGVGDFSQVVSLIVA